jgi:probable rRNA maturation factor
VTNRQPSLPPLSVEVSVTIEYEPDRLGGLDRERLPEFVRQVLDAEGQTGTWEVAVAFVSDDRLRALHRQFMGIDEVTDVMTFPLPTEPQWFGGAESSAVSGGDIVVSVDRADEQGPEHSMTVADELVFLVAHGLLHLCGWDDHSPEERAAMLRRGQEYLDRFWLGPK